MRQGKKNPALPVEERVNDLLQRMTLEEKVGQLLSYTSRDSAAFDNDGNFVGIADTAVMNRGVGAFSARGLWGGIPALQRAKCINAVERHMFEVMVGRSSVDYLRGILTVKK